MVWAAGLQELDDNPAMPEVLLRQHGRIGDNWRPLLAVADLAGGHWPELARNAALSAISAERRLTDTQRLLCSIRRAFSTFMPVPGQRDAIETGDLISRMLNDPEEEWGRANRGGAINAAWLREHLRGIINPARAQDWWDGEGNGRKHHSGYFREQFKEAWRTHLAGIEDPIFSFEGASPESSSAPGVSGNGFDNKGFFETRPKSQSGAAGADGSHIEKTQGKSTTSPHSPDDKIEYEEKTQGKSTASPNSSDSPDGFGRDPLKKKQSNGLDPNCEDQAPGRPPRRRLILADDIREYAAQNPKATLDQLHKKFGVSMSRLENILGRNRHGE